MRPISACCVLHLVKFHYLSRFYSYLEAAVVEPPVLAIFEEVAVAVGELECGIQRIR